MTNHGWFRAHWQDVIGIPKPDAGPWMQRDTPLPTSTVVELRPGTWGNNAEINRVPNPSGGGYTHIPATVTKAETSQLRYETNKKPFERSVFEKVADAAPDEITKDVLEAFSARPEADIYAVELFPSEAVTNEVIALTTDDGQELDVQLVGVGVEEPDGYPGTFVQAPEEALRTPGSAILRAIPACDLLVASPGLEYIHIPMYVIENADPRLALINPDRGWIGESVSDSLVLGDSETREMRSAVAEKARPGEGQKMLVDYVPDVLVDTNTEIQASGQASLDDVFSHAH